MMSVPPSALLRRASSFCPASPTPFLYHALFAQKSFFVLKREQLLGAGLFAIVGLI